MTHNTERMHRNRHRLAERDGGWVCFYCQTPIKCPACFPGTLIPATFDHVLPKARGGTNVLTNLVLACSPCNIRKGDRDEPHAPRVPRGALTQTIADVVDAQRFLAGRQSGPPEGCASSPAGG